MQLVNVFIQDGWFALIICVHTDLMLSFFKFDWIHWRIYLVSMTFFLNVFFVNLYNA